MSITVVRRLSGAVSLLALLTINFAVLWLREYLQRSEANSVDICRFADPPRDLRCVPLEPLGAAERTLGILAILCGLVFVVALWRASRRKRQVGSATAVTESETEVAV